MTSPAQSARVRPATVDDAELIHRLIVELAIYEKEPDAVRTTPAQLRAQMQQPQPPFKALIGEWDGQPVAFALYFHNYSTWRGCAGVYLEDLFVLPEYRGRGLGLLLLRRLAQITVSRGGARLEWAVLDWNTPAIDFYKALGAFPMDEWTTFRLTDEPLKALARGGQR